MQSRNHSVNNITCLLIKNHAEYNHLKSSLEKCHSLLSSTVGDAAINTGTKETALGIIIDSAWFFIS